MSTLQPHQQRVVDEKDELDKKTQALSNFIGLNGVFNTLPADEQERLRVQNDLMWQYSEILGARIAAFPKLKALVSTEAHCALRGSIHEIWASIWLGQEEFDVARAAYGASSLEDDRRVYRTLQAYEWKRQQVGD